MLDYFDYSLDGNSVKRYQLHESLGQGAYGQVWRATDSENNSIVALKKPTQTSGDIFKRFRNEVKFYQQMRGCPHILQMFDYNINSLSPFLTTEYCNLGNARSRMWELKFNRIRTIGLAFHAAAALSDVHNNGLLHRDIKPDNMLLRTDMQGNWMLKLGDPGLACFPARHVFDYGATTTVKGTEAYIAPELYNYGAEYTAAADTFSLGISIVEMLTGNRPLAGAKIQEFSSDLNSLLSRMVSSNPQERPKMSDVKKLILYNYQVEVQKSQNRVEVGIGLCILGAIGLGGYFLLKDS